jgi:hypothetical protein
MHAFSDTLKLEPSVLSSFESVRDGNVNGDLVNIVFEDNETSVNSAGLIKNAVECRDGLALRNLAVSNSPV